MRKRRHHHGHIKASAYKPLKPPLPHLGLGGFFYAHKAGKLTIRRPDKIREFFEGEYDELGD